MISKKLKCMTLFTTTALLLSSCTYSYESTVITPDATNAVTTFDGDASPLKMIQGGDTYYSFVGTFGETSYALSASDDITKTNIVYEPSRPAIVWFADANEDYITWCETSEVGNTFLLYEEETDTVSELFLCNSADYQIRNVALYNDFVFFANIDYTKETADVMCYNILDKTLTSIYSAEFAEKYAITSLSVSQNILTIVTNVNGLSKIANIDLDTMAEPTITEIPKEAYFIFDAEYDVSTSTFALYYISTKNKECVGTYKAGQEAIENIFTFTNGYYAYQDSIEYVDGDIYWVMQANRKSITTTPERYLFMIWDHETNELFEYSRTYGFCFADTDCYYFSFDKDFYYTNVLMSTVD